MAAFSIQTVEAKPMALSVKKEKKQSEKKKPNTNEESSYLSKKEDWTEYFHETALINYPGRDEWRKRLCFTLLYEGSLGEMVVQKEFCWKYKISMRSIERWIRDYPDIADAWQDFKESLAAHRYIGCIKRKYDSYSAFRDIHLLDGKEDAVNRYHLELKKLKDMEEQIRYLVEIVKPKTITAIEMQEQRESNV
jgi:hypothetical protein